VQFGTSLSSAVTIGIYLNVLHRRYHQPRVTAFTLAVLLIGIRSLALYACRMLREDGQRPLVERHFSALSFIDGRTFHVDLSRDRPA
jgi:hypothetical protein